MAGVIGREKKKCFEYLLDEQARLLEQHGANSNITVFNDPRPDRCYANFDKSLCWESTHLGSTGQRICPFSFCPTVPGCAAVEGSYHVQRTCQLNGSWTDPIYSQCIDVIKKHPQCIVGYCHSCPDLLRELVINVSLTLSVISVALLLTALILFSLFKSLQCRRLSIHKNLASAFVLRFAVLAIWTVLQSTNAFQDCSAFVPLPLWNIEWLCKTVIWMVIYFQVASVIWMLIEGGYLYSRFTVFAMRHSEGPYAAYVIGGWGVPLIVVLVWTAIHESKSRQLRGSFCWLPYAQGAHLWILSGTMGLALVLNLLFLLGIVVILVQKLRAENTAESRKIWRTIKATLLLVPLLGISNIPLFYEPPEPSSAYMLGSAILQHSQGIFIAVLYCFLNSEIQDAVKRQLVKVPIFERFRTRVKSTYETERTYVPDSARMNHRGVPMEELHPGHGRALSDATSMRSPSIKRDRIDVDNGVVAPITEDDRFIMIDDSSPPAYASAIADCASIDRSW